MVGKLVLVNWWYKNIFLATILTNILENVESNVCSIIECVRCLHHLVKCIVVHLHFVVSFDTCRFSFMYALLMYIGFSCAGVHALVWKVLLRQECTNPRCQSDKFCLVAPNVCWSSGWNLLQSCFWCLEFWDVSQISVRFVHLSFSVLKAGILKQIFRFCCYSFCSADHWTNLFLSPLICLS